MVVDWTPVCFCHKVHTAVGFGCHHFWASGRYFWGDFLGREAVGSVIHLCHNFVILYRHTVVSTLVRYKHFHVVYTLTRKELGGSQFQLIFNAAFKVLIYSVEDYGKMSKINAKLSKQGF